MRHAPPPLLTATLLPPPSPPLSSPQPPVATEHSPQGGVTSGTARASDAAAGMEGVQATLLKQHKAGERQRQVLHPFQVKEEVGLPPSKGEGGWMWGDAGWQLAEGVLAGDNAAGSDGVQGPGEAGWEYCCRADRSHSIEGQLGGTDQGVLVQGASSAVYERDGGLAWSRSCQPDSHARRRLWHRRRHRQGGSLHPSFSSDLAAPALRARHGQQGEGLDVRQDAGSGGSGGGRETGVGDVGAGGRGEAVCRSPPSSFPLASSHLTSMASSHTSPPLTQLDTQPDSPSLTRAHVQVSG